MMLKRKLGRSGLLRASFRSERGLSRSVAARQSGPQGNPLPRRSRFQGLSSTDSTRQSPAMRPTKLVSSIVLLSSVMLVLNRRFSVTASAWSMGVSFW